MNDLTIELRQDNGKHLYEQIYLHIKREIRKGSCSKGRSFPLLVLWQNFSRYQEAR